MRPLALSERLESTGSVSLAELLKGEKPPLEGETSLSLEEYTDEILASGMPGLRRFSGRALRLQLDSYLERIIDRDFPELGRQVRNPAGLRRWMAAYAAASSTTTSFEKIRQAATSGEVINSAEPRPRPTATSSNDCGSSIQFRDGHRAAAT